MVTRQVPTVLAFGVKARRVAQRGADGFTPQRAPGFCFPAGRGTILASAQTQ